MHLWCAIYLLRKCDIISRCEIAIYSPLANVVESTNCLVRFAHAICSALPSAIYLLCKCDIISQARQRYIRLWRMWWKVCEYKSSRPMRTQCAHVPKAHIAPQAYRAFEYLACGEVCKSISQIREDLYRFSLSASSDKLNFPRVPFRGTYLRVGRKELYIRAP